MGTRQISTSLSKEDFLSLSREFHNSGNLNSVSALARKYNISSNDILTLTFMDAISDSDMPLIKYLLKQPEIIDTMCVPDSSGYNALFLSLMATDKPEISEAISESIKERNHFEDNALNQNQEDILLSIVKLPLYEYMSEVDYFYYLKDNYLQYLYTEQSLSSFEKFMGQNVPMLDYE